METITKILVSIGISTAFFLLVRYLYYKGWDRLADLWNKNKELLSRAAKDFGKGTVVVVEEAGGLGKTFVKWFTNAIEAVVVSSMLAAVVYLIIRDGGIEALLARTMAAACLSNPSLDCEYQNVLGVLGMSLVLLTSIVIYSMRLFNDLFNQVNIDKEEMSRSYNDDMISLLTDIQRLQTVENLKGLADWKGMAYTTVQRYIKTFEQDGYVTVVRNGKGSPTEVYAK